VIRSQIDPLVLRQRTVDGSERTSAVRIMPDMRPALPRNACLPQVDDRVIIPNRRLTAFSVGPADAIGIHITRAGPARTDRCPAARAAAQTKRFGHALEVVRFLALA
jgi:hypothetical protein